MPTAARQRDASSGKTRRAIVKRLKAEGPVDSARLARRMGLTPMAVRQHLYALQREKLVTAEERKGARGRPAKYWQLTREADRLFPDAYAELSVALIGMTRHPAPAGLLDAPACLFSSGAVMQIRHEHIGSVLRKFFSDGLTHS